MTDLTDSFCERCGARYAFVANGPKGLSLKGARVLARGLKNFVFTDGQSISDAMELARHEDNREASTRIAEAFHRTFNFCMSCRQYACDRCWNETAGACLSCSPAPEADVVVTAQRLPMSWPATAEDLPTLQGSTKPPEAEWSLSAETPVADADRVAAGTAPSNEPSILGERSPAGPGQEPDPLAWPAADLAEVQQAKAAGSAASKGSNGKDRRDPRRKAADIEAASAWPVTDQISPEMALTAEELEIVHTHLSEASSKSIQTATAASTAPETQAASQAPLLEEQRTWWNSGVPDEDQNQAADWALDDAVTEDRPAPAWELTPVASTGAISAEASATFEAPQAESADEPSTLEADLPPVSPKLLRRTSTSDDLPPLTPSEPQPQTHEPVGLVARLFGRRAPKPGPSLAAGPRRASSKRGLPAGESWPHATAWSERTIEARRWWLDADATTAGPVPMTADGVFPPERVDAQPIVAPEPAAERSPQPRRTVPTRTKRAPANPPSPTAQVPSQAAPIDIDSRAAAALRLSAVGAAIELSASNEAWQHAAFEASRDAQAAPAAPAAPAHEPAWLRVQREAAEPEPDRSMHVPEAALVAAPAEVPATEEPAAAVPAAEEPAQQAQATESQAAEIQPAPAHEAPAQEAPAPATFEMPVQAPATPWPPLGASWPAREKPGAPWPAPDATAVSAVVAAGKVPAPTMAEMWAQSAQEVLNRGSVRVCHHCALPVSTMARFCRRCGTQQV